MGILEYNSVNNELVVNYDELNKKIFKLLPIYEGRVKDSNIKLEKNIAYSNFKKNLSLLCLQINGIISKIEIHSNLLEVLTILEGLKALGSDSHEEVRSAILHCTNLIKDIRG